MKGAELKLLAMLLPTIWSGEPAQDHPPGTEYTILVEYRQQDGLGFSRFDISVPKPTAQVSIAHTICRLVHDRAEVVNESTNLTVAMYYDLNLEDFVPADVPYQEGDDRLARRRARRLGSYHWSSGYDRGSLTFSGAIYEGRSRRTIAFNHETDCVEGRYRPQPAR